MTKPKPKPVAPAPAAKPGGVLGTPAAPAATTAAKPATAATTAAAPATTAAAKAGGVLGTPPPVDPALAAPSTYKDRVQNVENIVGRITSQDSPLMRQAATDGRRNLANQSYGYDASLQNARTMATRIENRRQRVHEAAESLKTRTWQSGENVAERTWQSGEKAKDRTFDEKMQDARLTQEDQVQLRDIAFREGQGAADRALQEKLAEMGYTDKAAERTWQSGENELTREAETEISNANNASQEKIAGWNLSAEDKKAAGSLASTASTTYEQAIQTIMQNDDLSADQRNTQLKNARSRYDTFIDGLQDLFDTDLGFDTPPTTTPAPDDEDEDEDEDEEPRTTWNPFDSRGDH